MRVVDAITGCGADGSAAQAIVNLSRFDEARLNVAVLARPVAVGGNVDHSLKVSDRVILILFRVVAKRVHVIRIGGESHERVIAEISNGRRRSECDLAYVFTPTGSNQAVNGVVGVGCIRINLLVIIKHDQRSVVADGRNVADRIISVVKVLNHGWVLEKRSRKTVETLWASR